MINPNKSRSAPILKSQVKPHTNDILEGIVNSTFLAFRSYLIIMRAAGFKISGPGGPDFKKSGKTAHK